MRNPVRPRLRAFMDSTRGFRRPRACLLLARSLVLAVSVVAFVRLSISSESGHTADFVERGEWARERLAGSKATRGFVNQRVSHDKPEVSTESPSQRSTPPLFPPKESLPENAVTFVLVATMNPDSAPRIANLLASMRTFLDKDTPKQVVAELLVLVPTLSWSGGSSPRLRLVTTRRGVQRGWLRNRTRCRRRLTPCATPRRTRRNENREVWGTGYKCF